jgi:hypothetical protein
VVVHTRIFGCVRTGDEERLLHTRDGHTTAGTIKLLCCLREFVSQTALTFRTRLCMQLGVSRSMEMDILFLRPAPLKKSYWAGEYSPVACVCLHS